MSEVRTSLLSDIIEPSNSFRRAQALVVRKERHNNRPIIVYNQTINRFTHLNVYPVQAYRWVNRRNLATRYVQHSRVQHVIEGIITRGQLHDTFAYVDNLRATIGYHGQIWNFLKSRRSMTFFSSQRALFAPSNCLFGFKVLVDPVKESPPPRSVKTTYEVCTLLSVDITFIG